jgi:hypothetical protein
MKPCQNVRADSSPAGFKPNGARGVVAPTSPSTIPWRAVALAQAAAIKRFSLLSARIFCHSRNVMRLLVELLIIAALIYYGWTTPFKDHVAEANRTITNQLHGLGKSLQKNQDPSVRRY